MNEFIKKDALSALNQTIILLELDKVDTLELKKLSNTTIHAASAFQDDYSTSIATLIYALSKVIERDGTQIPKSKIIALMHKALEAVENDEDHNFKLAIEKLYDEISKIDAKLKMYVQEVVNQAQVRKGCKLCELGISTTQASHVMGVSSWDLMEYMGQTKIHEQDETITDVSSRLKYARQLFS